MNFSEIIIGVMRWGIWGVDFSIPEAQKIIDACLQENLYTFDHADIYGGHTTENLFGKAFSEMKIPRENIQLISKCGIQMNSDVKSYEIKSYNYSKEYILNQVDESLKNLHTDYLDVLLLHRPSPLMNPEEIAAAFGILRSSGKVLDFGVSNFSPSQFDLVSKYYPNLVTNQLEISVNHTQSFYDGTLDQMMMKKIRPTAWSVMGNYFSNPGSEQNLRIQTVLKELCIQYNAEENQLLLAFLLKHPAKIIPVIGTSKAETVKKFKQSLNITLNTTDWFKILEASHGKEVD